VLTLDAQVLLHHGRVVWAIDCRSFSSTCETCHQRLACDPGFLLGTTASQRIVGSAFRRWAVSSNPSAGATLPALSARAHWARGGW